MESVQNIKRRRASVLNISQITKAMELVAATKMRRSQEIALSLRPYAAVVRELLANLSLALKKSELPLPPLLEKRTVKKRAVVLVTSDKGLCGAFNANVLRRAEVFLKENKVLENKEKYVFIAVGTKALAFCIKKKLTVAASFSRIGDYTTPQETKPISDFIVSGFLEKQWDEVLFFSTHFRTALKQEVKESRVLPVDFPIAEGEQREVGDYLIEPSPQEALSRLIPHLIAMEVYHLILEANASEHAARRAAMKNATDNAEELSRELTLLYNKSRQELVTKEIIEITNGAQYAER